MKCSSFQTQVETIYSRLKIPVEFIDGESLEKMTVEDFVQMICILSDYDYIPKSELEVKLKRALEVKLDELRR